MNVFICGQKSFGCAVLKRLILDGHKVVGVAVPPPEKYYDALHIGAIKNKIKGINVADRVLSSMIPEGTDIIIAAHSHQFISEKTAARSRHGAIGYHPSALPRHRGRDAVRWTVAMKDAITAGTVYKLDGVVDGGPVIMQRFIHVGKDWDYKKLWSVLFQDGVDLISESIKKIESGTAVYTEQQNEFAAWEPAFDSGRLYRPELLQIGGN